MILPFLARFWPYIAIAILGAGLYFSVRHNGVLAARVDQVVGINKDNIAVMGAKDAQAAHANEIAAAAQAEADQWHKRYNSKRMEIANAKPEDDGPLARVLRFALDQLPGSGSDQTSPGSPAPDPGKPSHVPGRP